MKFTIPTTCYRCGEQTNRDYRENIWSHCDFGLCLDFNQGEKWQEAMWFNFHRPGLFLHYNVRDLDHFVFRKIWFDTAEQKIPIPKDFTSIDEVGLWLDNNSLFI